VDYYENLISQIQLFIDRTSHMPMGTRCDINIVYSNSQSPKYWRHTSTKHCSLHPQCVNGMPVFT